MDGQAGPYTDEAPPESSQRRRGRSATSRPVYAQAAAQSRSPQIPSWWPESREVFGPDYLYPRKE